MTIRFARLVAILLMLCAPSALAQTHAVFTGLGTRPDTIADFDVATGTLNWEMSRSFPFANWVIFRAPAITGDGRFALWPASNPHLVGGFVVRDLTTGAMGGAPFPPSLINSTLDFASLALAHPRRQRIYLPMAGGYMLVMEPAGIRRVAGCFRPLDGAISLDGSRLFVVCDDRVVVFDTITETTIRTVTFPTQAIRVEANRDGSRMVVLAHAWRLTLHDTNTGEVLASQDLEQAPMAIGLHSNADRTVIYASFAVNRPGLATVQETRVYSFDSLAPLTTLPAAFHSMSFAADGTTAIGVSPHADGFLFSGRCQVVFLDPATHVVLDRSYLAHCNSPSSVVLVEPPLPPSNVLVSVANRQATLTWELAAQSPAASSYAVDVSMQSGGPVRATLSTLSDATTLSVDNVPPGRYYVRVRAINAVGSSGSSEEQQVTVY